MSGHSIAVIGAGAAGLSAALFLGEAGYRVRVFEASAAVGGKCRATTVDGLPVDLGAVLVSHAAAEVRRLARRFGRRLVPLRRGDGPVLLDPSSGGEVYAGPAAKRALAKAVLAFERDHWCWRRRARGGRWFEAETAAVSVADYLAAPERRALLPVVEGLMAGYGYGPLAAVPAAYLFHYYPLLRRYVLLPWRNAGFMLEGGLAALWQAVAARLPVETGSPVARVTRGPPCTVAVNGREEAFDRVVLACPAEVVATILDATPEERDILGRVRTVGYRAIAARATGLPNDYCHVPTWTRRGHEGWPVSWYRSHAQSDATVFYVFADPTASDQAVSATLRERAARLGISIGDVLAHERWAFFPHFAMADLASGVLDRLAARQGQGGVYFAGEFLTFSSVEHVVRHARELVARHF